MAEVSREVELIKEATQFLEELKIVEERIESNKRKADKSRTILAALAMVAILICAAFWIHKMIVWLNEPTEDEYITNYSDENGNNRLDQGEWNYTVDEDGNIVDVDEDLNNFE